MAVKVLTLSDGTREDDPHVSSLKRELAVLMQATQGCSSICRYLGITRQGGKFLIVMTKYERSLAALIKRQGEEGTAFHLCLSHMLIQLLLNLGLA